MKIRVLDGQSLFDIAIRRCGDAKAAYAIAELNGLSITEPLMAGQALEIPEPYDKDVSGYFSSRNIEPATALTADVFDSVEDEGLDFWIVEVDFIIS